MGGINAAHASMTFLADVFDASRLRANAGRLRGHTIHDCAGAL